MASNANVKVKVAKPKATAKPIPSGLPTAQYGALVAVGAGGAAIYAKGGVYTMVNGQGQVVHTMAMALNGYPPPAHGGRWRWLVAQSGGLAPTLTKLGLAGGVVVAAKVAATAKAKAKVVAQPA